MWSGTPHPFFFSRYLGNQTTFFNALFFKMCAWGIASVWNKPHVKAPISCRAIGEGVPHQGQSSTTVSCYYSLLLDFFLFFFILRSSWKTSISEHLSCQIDMKLLIRTFKRCIFIIIEKKNFRKNFRFLGIFEGGWCLKYL